MATTKKPASTAKATTKVSEKAVETKADEKILAEKAVAPKTSAAAKKTEAKPVAKKATAKATTAKKPTAKTTTKKTATKKTATKKENNMFVQFAGMEFDTATIEKAVKADYTAKNGKKTMTSVSIYIKPEDMKAYYVIDGIIGDIAL